MRLNLWLCASIGLLGGIAQASDPRAVADAPYANMPRIAPIGVRIGQHLGIPEDAKGPPVDAAKGYRLEQLGDGLYMITDNAYQSMFMVYENGVVVVDAPPSYSAHIVKGIREVSNEPITHLVYSHSHVDHIAGAKSLGSVPTIIAQKKRSASSSEPKIQTGRFPPSRSTIATYSRRAARCSSCRITAMRTSPATSSSMRRSSRP